MTTSIFCTQFRDVTDIEGANGNFSHLYSAKWVGDGQRYSIKRSQHKITADTTILTRFLSEVKAIATPHRHKHIVAIKQAWIEDDYVYIQLGLCGGPVGVDSNGDRVVLPEKEVWRVYRAMRAALTHMHRYSIVHMDVKPQNILHAGKNKYKLVDFGQSCEIGSIPKGDWTTDSTYMSSEALSGAPPRPSADVFSLGLTLLELATGQPLPENGEGYRALRDPARFVWPGPCNVSPRLERLIRSMLAPEASRLAFHKPLLWAPSWFTRGYRELQAPYLSILEDTPSRDHSLESTLDYGVGGDVIHSGLASVNIRDRTRSDAGARGRGAAARVKLSFGGDGLGSGGSGGQGGDAARRPITLIRPDADIITQSGLFTHITPPQGFEPTPSPPSGLFTPPPDDTSTPTTPTTPNNPTDPALAALELPTPFTGAHNNITSPRALSTPTDDPGVAQDEEKVRHKQPRARLLPTYGSMETISDLVILFIVLFSGVSVFFSIFTIVALLVVIVAKPTRSMRRAIPDLWPLYSDDGLPHFMMFIALSVQTIVGCWLVTPLFLVEGVVLLLYGVWTGVCRYREVWGAAGDLAEGVDEE